MLAWAGKDFALSLFIRAALAAILLIFMINTSVYAETTATAVTKMNAAYAAFKERALQRYKAGTLPLLSNADDAPVLKQIWDVDAIIGSPPYSEKDILILSDLIKIQDEIITDYGVLSGNTKLYPMGRAAEGIVHSTVATLKISSALFLALKDSWEHPLTTPHADKHPAWTREVEGDTSNVFFNIIAMLQAMSDTEELQEFLANALAQNAPVLADGVPITKRPVIVAVVQSALPSFKPTVQTSLRRVIDALPQTRCEGLCTVQ